MRLPPELLLLHYSYWLEAGRAQWSISSVFLTLKHDASSIASARSAFGAWVEENHPSLHDDLWGQYWLAGVAAGLSYCHKTGIPDEQRLAGLIYACANLRRYAVTFKLPLPPMLNCSMMKIASVRINQPGFRVRKGPNIIYPLAPLHFCLPISKAAEQINYLRMLQITNDNLGTVALLEGDIQQAQQFFIKSLNISQECGQTREMLASLHDLANVSIAQGGLDGALKLLAVVLNHPASDQNSLNRPERLRDEAEKLRGQIEAQLDQARYQLAWERGQRQRLADVVTQIPN